MVSRTAIWVVAVIVLGAATGGVGYYEGTLHTSSSPSAIRNSTLAILAAGTLGGSLFPRVAQAFVNDTPGVSAPTASQLYAPSLTVMSDIAKEGAIADVAAAADFRLIPQDLYPTFADYEIVFGSTPEVLAYNASLPAFAGVNASNWAYDLENATTGAGAVPFGVWNASTDPNGYNEIFDLLLQGELHGPSATSFYGQFYAGAPGTIAVANPSTTRVESESAAATLVSTGTVCAVITYRSYAASHHMTYVSFDPIVGLAATNASAIADYASVSTGIVSSTGGTQVVSAAPILFAATVPLDASNSSLGVAFLHVLLSPQGEAILSAGGAFTPIFPGWIDQPSRAPPELAPDVVAMPAWAESDLTV